MHHVVTYDLVRLSQTNVHVNIRGQRDQSIHIIDKISKCLHIYLFRHLNSLQHFDYSPSNYTSKDTNFVLIKCWIT